MHERAILVVLDKDGRASGGLYLDDGFSIKPNATLTTEFTVQNKNLDTVIT